MTVHFAINVQASQPNRIRRAGYFYDDVSMSQHAESNFCYLLIFWVYLINKNKYSLVHVYLPDGTSNKQAIFYDDVSMSQRTIMSPQM